MRLIRYQYPNIHQVVERFFNNERSEFGRFGSLLDSWFQTEATRAPAIDWHESDDSYILSVELPGVKKEEIRLEVDQGQVSIRTERVVDAKDSKETVLHERTVSLPEGIAGEKATAAFADGVLTLTFPKREEDKPRTIEIK